MNHSEHLQLDSSLTDTERWLQKHRSQVKVDPTGSPAHIQAHRHKLQVSSLLINTRAGTGHLKLEHGVILCITLCVGALKSTLRCD